MFAEALKDFIIFLTAEKGLSPHSIKAYSSDVRLFIRFAMTLQLTSLAEITEQTITSFLLFLKTQKYASSTRMRLLMTLKVFFRFLKREGVIQKDVTLFMETHKIWQTIPDLLSYEEIKKLFLQPDTTTFLGARDLAILEVLYASGLRVSELCNLNIQDVDDTVVRVVGKRGKERLVPIGKKAVEAIDHYLIYFRAEQNQKALFLTSKARRIDRIEVFKRIKKYAQQAGIVKNVSPHTLRHCFATHLLNGGGDLRIIQEMLGHSNITTTQRYMHLTQDQLQKAFIQFHPRNTL